MLGKMPRWLLIVGGLALTQAAGLVIPVAPAQAQFWGGQGGGGGFFGGWFGGGPRYAPRYERAPRQHREYEYSRPESDASHAPPPRKADKSDVAPTTSIVVMGDAMADWLAYGLEDAFADAPEVGIVRKNKTYSGLLHYDVKGDLDWWHVARDLLAQEKPSYVVMMIGMNDRQNIRERDLAKEAEKEAKEKEEQKKAAEKRPADENKPVDEKRTAEEKKPSDSEAESDQAKPADQKATEEKKSVRQANGTLEFRSEQWERVYNKRIDDTIAALKSKGAPVFWVGLPAIKGAKSTSDTSYLNNLYRMRAQRAGIVFIDVWDGFVDENGRYTSYGPDYEGQQRRLRTDDGVFFTKYGARKLAHYVDREIRRYMGNRIVSLPSQPTAPVAPSNGKPSDRPLAGPVVPLADVPANSDELLGSNAGGRVQGDALATQVLVKGEPTVPQPGRADDFIWPPGSTSRPVAVERPQASAPEPAPGDHENAAPEPPATAEPSADEAKKKQQRPKHAEAKPRPARQHYDQPRPPQPAQAQRPDPFRQLFGIFR